MQITDGDWTLLKWDPVTGKSTWRMERDGEVTIRTDQPVDDLIRENAAVRNASAGNRFGDFVKVASIPMAVLWDEKTGLINAFNQNDNRYVSKWLNDSDNRAWRTFEGNV